ncbi:MAG: Mrp/NBP35 family ATP-binding protein [Firmicutes bacterium]|nr:Mrp/NBP35 family ATP-binding protein [Bacillota bacterium]
MDMGMIRNLEITDDTVSMTVVLTIQGCPLKSMIQEETAAKLKAVSGVKHVNIEWGSMNGQERAELSQRLRGPQKKSPFLTGETAARIIGVASGKGGVGKSTVTVNLAVSLGKLGYKVGVIDADIYGFSVARMLGMLSRPVILDNNMIMPMARHGIRAISMGNLVDEDQPIVWRGPMLGKMLEQFLADVYWGELDYLLLDLPPGTGDMALSVQQMMPKSEILLVTTPQAAAANVAQRVAGFAEKTGQRLIGVVENMAYFVCPHCGEKTAIFGEGGGERIAKGAGTELLGRLPLTPAVREGGDEGTPIVTADPESPAAKAFMELAERVVKTSQADTGVRYLSLGTEA